MIRSGLIHSLLPDGFPEIAAIPLPARSTDHASDPPPQPAVKVGGSGSERLSDGGQSRDIQALFGGGGDDHLAFTGEHDVLTFAHGGAGDDVITDERNQSLLIGGQGTDIITLGRHSGTAWGGDALILNGNSGASAVGAPYSADLRLTELIDDSVMDVISGGAGIDTIYVGRFDRVDGGAGAGDIAHAVLSGLSASVRLDFTVGSAGALLETALSADIDGFEFYRVTGTNFADTLRISADGLVGDVDGGGGDDILSVGDSADPSDYALTGPLRGGEGDDRLSGGNSRNDLEGGDGADVIRGGDGADFINAERNLAQENEFWSDDGEIDRVFGEGGNDHIVAGIGDILDGGAGSDHVVLVLGRLGRGVTLDLGQNAIATLAELGYAEFKSVESVGLIATDHDDVIMGSSGDDSVLGLAGDDRLDAGRGGSHDRLEGGYGDDELSFAIYAGDDGYADGGEGEDVVVLRGARSSYSIEERLFGGFEVTGGGRTYDIVDVELLRFDDITVRIADTVRPEVRLTGTDDSDVLWPGERGAFYDYVLSGREGSDWLYGRHGDDILDGGAGRDVMAGGIGDDLYVVDDAGDLIMELGGQGSDTVAVSMHFSLVGVENVENVTLTGAKDIAARGNDLDNRLTGNAGNNALTGGKGDDTYVVQTIGDRVVELNGEGDDEVVSSVNWNLAGMYVERLTLTGSAKYGTGNSLDNVLTGNAAVNVLSGGKGDDTYVIQTRGDQAIEKAGEGDDLVISSVDFNMGGSYLERLTLTGAAKYGTGNSLDNTITGNASNNVLSGGSGADTLIGGKGHDRYIVDNAKDRVVEKSGEGSDLIVSSVSYSLAGTYVERLELSGTAALNATGNSLDNVLTGNGGANRLEGGGGADTLIGGAGGDTYVYRAASDSTVARSDTITELGFGDRLDLSLIDASSAAGGDQAFALVDAFSGARGQATLTYDATAKLSTLLLDLDGDRSADMRILIGGDANEARIVW